MCVPTHTISYMNPEWMISYGFNDCTLFNTENKSGFKATDLERGGSLTVLVAK